MTVTKAVAAVESVESTNPNGEFDLILSASTKDRDGESIRTRAFEPLPDHISMDIDHGMSVATTVGSGVPSYAEDGTLRVRGTYASTELGQTVRTLVTEGHVRTASVAFITGQVEKAAGGHKEIVTGELLNGAFTPVPSNRDARVLSSKAFTATEEMREAAVKEGRRNSTSDSSLLQDAHDSLVAAGATCSTGKSARRVDIHEVGAPDADADREAKSLTAPGPAQAGPGAAEPPTDDELAVRAHAIRARVAAL